MSDLSPECAPKRTSVDHFEFMGSRPNGMECDIIDFRALSAMAKARNQRSGKILVRHPKKNFFNSIGMPTGRDDVRSRGKPEVVGQRPK